MATCTPLSIRNRHCGSTCCNLTFRYCFHIRSSVIPQTCITKHVLVTESVCCVTLFLKCISWACFRNDGEELRRVYLTVSLRILAYAIYINCFQKQKLKIEDISIIFAQNTNCEYTL